MNHYISVLVPTASGRWHAFFPDFPACEELFIDWQECIADQEPSAFDCGGGYPFATECYDASSPYFYCAFPS